MRQYHTMDKSTWKNGPWQSEPDKMQWIDAETDLDCLIVRNAFGALCGYIGIDKNHPLFKIDYNNTPNLEVHGGLTFSDLCQEWDDPSKGICHIPEGNRPKNIWWFGFDCAHYCDFIPIYTSPNYGFMRSHVGTTYRTIEYVQSEIRHLAKQLKEFDNNIFTMQIGRAHV